MDDLKLAPAWRRGVAGPVWMLTCEKPVKLSRWVPEEGEMRMETIEVSRDSLLNGDGSWRPADPEEAAEAVELATQASLWGDESGNAATRALIGISATEMSPGYRAERARIAAEDDEALAAGRDDERERPLRDFVLTAASRTCEPHARLDCPECTPWLAERPDARGHTVEKARALVRQFDPSGENYSLRDWLRSVEAGAVFGSGGDDDESANLPTPDEMLERLVTHERQAEEHWRSRRVSEFDHHKIEELMAKTGHGRAEVERAWLMGMTVQNAQADFVWLLHQLPGGLVDQAGPLITAVLGEFPVISRNAHGARFLRAEVERRIAGGQTTTPDAPVSEAMADEARTVREELEQIRPRDLIADLRSVREELTRSGPPLLTAIVELLRRAEDAALGVTRPPLGMVPYLPTHNHQPHESCSPDCPVFQWERHVDQFGNPYDVQGDRC